MGSEVSDDIHYRGKRKALSNVRGLEQIREEERFCRWLRLDEERYKAKKAALKADEDIRARHHDDLGFEKWNPNRALNIQDFDYLHLHRHQFSKQIRNQLETIADKITHIRRDGMDGYFNKLERNLGWTVSMVPLLFTQLPVVEKLVRCGKWSNAHNSGRCHKSDLCPLCLWNDFLKVLVAAYGEKSGAFHRSPFWIFFTLSFTTSKANSKAVFKTLEKEDYEASDDGFRRDGLHGGYYDPAPVRLGDDTGDQSHFGMMEARILWTICQKAAESLYPEILSGYKIKHEGMFRSFPDGVRCLPHQHGIGNSRIDTDGKFIAQRFYDAMQAGLEQYGHLLNREYFPDVHVFQIPNPKALEKCIVYMEKVVPIGLIVAEALNLPEAKQADGTWNRRYVEKLITQLQAFAEDLTENLFHGCKFYVEEKNLRRRKTVGNLVFNDNGTCIGDEPVWHINKRRKKAKADRAARMRRKKRKQELLEAEHGKFPAAVAVGDPTPQHRSKSPQTPSGHDEEKRDRDGCIRQGKVSPPDCPASSADPPIGREAIGQLNQIRSPVRPAAEIGSLPSLATQYTYLAQNAKVSIKPSDNPKQERPNACRKGFS